MINDCKVWETKALVKMKKMDEAKKLLDRLAVVVAPLMKRRSFKINLLKEFYPKNPGLLGMNMNKSSISIRLRPHNDVDSFYPWEHLLG